jgi:hypothetical protein
MSADINININTRGDVSGVQQVDNSVQELEQQAGKLRDSFILAFQIDLVRRFIDGLMRVNAELQRAVDRGIAFNAAMQDTADSIRAAMIAAADGSLDFARAQNLAEATTRRLADAADRAAVPIAQYTALFARQAPLATEAGLSMEQWESILGDSAVAASNMGMTIGELETRIQQLLSGQVGERNNFARALGITQEDLRAAQEAGDLTDYLRGKLAGWQQEVEGLNAAKARLGNAIDRALGSATLQIFAALDEGIAKVGDSVREIDPQILMQLADALGVAVKVGLDATAWAVDNADAVTLLAASFTSLGLAMATLRWGPLLASKAKLLTATFAQTKATQAATAAQLQHNAAKTAGVAASTRLAAALGFVGAAGVAAFVGWQIGERIDELTGFSESFAKAGERARQSNRLFTDGLDAQLRNIREMAREMATIEEMEATRNRIIRERRQVHQALTAAIASGNNEARQAYDQQLTLIDRTLQALPRILQFNTERLAREQALAAELQNQNALKIEGIEIDLSRVAITLDELERLESITAEYELQNRLLIARAAGDEPKAAALDEELRKMREANRLRALGFTEERGYDPVGMANERVRLELAVADATRKTNAALRDRGKIAADNATAEELAAARLAKLGATRSERQIGIDGKPQEVFFRDGKRLGTEDQILDRRERFEGIPRDTPTSPQTSPATPSPQSPAATAQQTPQINPPALDTSGIVEAITGAFAQIQNQLDDLAGQIKDLAN